MKNDYIQGNNDMTLNINDLLLSISYALDFIDNDIAGDNHDHGKNVAYVAARIGQNLTLSNEELFDLISYALLHDNGMADLHRYGEKALKLGESTKLHCVEGEKNVKNFPFVTKLENIILYHHEHYDGSGIFGLKAEETPLFSRIIRLADYIAIKHSEDLTPVDICKRVEQGTGTLFDPQIVEAFMQVQSNIEFWLELNEKYLENAIFSMIPKIEIKIGYKELRDVSQVFSNIIDGKSPFTGNHSKGISEKVGILCGYYEYREEEYWKMRIAADLHDIGKLMVSNEILDKPGSLTEEEFLEIKGHTFHTRKVLEKIGGFEEITEWASNHHERLNGSGYPYGFSGDRLDRNSRIMACIDIYQALTEERPYRPPMKHDKAISIMKEMAANHFIDGAIIEDIDKLFQTSSQLYMYNLIYKNYQENRQKNKPSN